MKSIAVLTSGGDAPGMNAAVRAVVRTAIDRDLVPFGVAHGFSGLIDDDMRRFDLVDVGGIMHLAGTVLGTAREPRFKVEEHRRRARENLRRHGIGGLVVIGGNGSMCGALAIAPLDMPVIGVPGSIDNDVYGTDIAIGVDTALNTIVSAVDTLKATASSHERTFIIEVMGRDCGYLALMAGLAGGAEAVIVPESPPDYDRIATDLVDGYARGKQHGIVICAEGAAAGALVAEELARRCDLPLRVTVLGHLQRGGRPTVADRLLGTRLGAAAVEGLLDGRTGQMTCWRNEAVDFVPLDEVAACRVSLSESDRALAGVLAR